MRSRYVSLIWLALIESAAAQQIYIPQTQRPSGQDRIRTRDGVECSQSIDSALTFDAGAMALPPNWTNGYGYNPNPQPQTPNQWNYGGYARITIPLGMPPRKIDCGELYQLELQRLRLEVEYLRQKMAAPEIAEPLPDLPPPKKKK